MKSEFVANNGYTVKRLDNRQIQVFKGKGKSPARLLLMEVGENRTPSCGCPVYGRCGHQIAAEEFAAMERKPATVDAHEQRMALLAEGWA